MAPSYCIYFNAQCIKQLIKHTLNLLAASFGAVRDTSISGWMPSLLALGSSTSQPDGMSIEMIGGTFPPAAARS